MGSESSLAHVDLASGGGKNQEEVDGAFGFGGQTGHSPNPNGIPSPNPGLAGGTTAYPG